jgi:integrase
MAGRSANGRSTIYQDKFGRWHGQVSMGRDIGGAAVRRHVSGKTKSLVTKKVRVLEAERDSGKPAVHSIRTTLGEWLNEWIADKATGRYVARSTLDGYRTDQLHLNRIGNVRLSELAPAHIEHLWRAMTEAGLLATIQHCRRTLSAALNDAVALGMIGRNPVPLARTPRYSPEEPEPYTVDEMRRILDAAGQFPNGVLYMVLAATGARRSEIVGLQWMHFHPGPPGALNLRQQLQRGYWRHGCADPSQCRKRAVDCPERTGDGGLSIVALKTAKSRRTVVLPASLTEELLAHQATQQTDRIAASVWDDRNWIFCHPASGSPLDPRAISRGFADLCRAAQVPVRKLHTLRHSFATVQLTVGGQPLHVVSRQLGHSSARVTSGTYGHVLVAQDELAAAETERLLFGDG